MRLRLLRNLACLLVLTYLVIGSPVPAKADSCESCYPEIQSCTWNHCTESCEWAADWCDFWCGYDVNTDDLHYFLCSPNPGGNNDGHCDCNGNVIPPGTP